MPKPPPSTPHSDLSGVHRDERSNVDVAVEQGQSSGDVEQAKRRSSGRPPLSETPKSRDQRG